SEAALRTRPRHRLAKLPARGSGGLFHTGSQPSCVIRSSIQQVIRWLHLDYAGQPAATKPMT
ncbi:hypothetical protein, partial [Salmonella enterica]|uniref:hypothetical protein n=1 Tax=Salmonella enterica TaxID=28901 RepID=UPI001ADB726A